MMALVPRGRYGMGRLEDYRFLTGQGRFVDDVAQGTAAEAVVLRAPYAHAVIRSVDAGRARSMPGVLAVLVESDLGLRPIPCITPLNAADRLVIPPRRVLARGRVRHVGEAVAFVVAETRRQAIDAADAIEVDYEPLPVVTDGADALASRAPQLWDEAPGNLAFRFERGDREAVGAAIDDAAHVITLDLMNQRVAALPLETRAGLAQHDADTGRSLLTLTGQGLHPIRSQLAQVFGEPVDHFDLTAPDVGGGFGCKNYLYPEWPLLILAARRTGRPVHWAAQRSEEIAAGAHGRDFRARARLALDDSGRFRALDVRAVANLGGGLSSSGPHSSTLAPATALGGVYAIPHVYLETRGAFTNCAPIDAYRGAGKPEANYIVERLVDKAARELGTDPAELRQRNVIRSFPYRTSLGQTIDTGDFAANIEGAMLRADREGFARRRADSERAGRLRGFGIACFLETSRGPDREGAEVRVGADGTVEVRLGTDSTGQGHETVLPRLAAERLGITVEAVRYVQADTRRTRVGEGHGGARTLHMGGAALCLAIDTVLGRAREETARLLQANAADLEYAGGFFAVSGTQRKISIFEIAGDVDVSAFELVEGAEITFPSGCHAAEVEVDRETGEVTLARYSGVDDYGRRLDTQLTLGQVVGGLAQGAGQALCEAIAYDPGTGQLVSGSLMDYTLPRAGDLPDFSIGFLETPTKRNPLGVKGAGQAGAIAAPATIMNALIDALAPLGIEDVPMPATAHAVWQAMRRAQAAN